MSHEEDIESVLCGITLKPPSHRLKRQVLDAVQRAKSADASADRLTLLRCGGAIAACLTMVLLAHWMVERQLAHWTPPLSSQPILRGDPSIYEDLGWGAQPGHLTRVSKISIPGGRREVGDYLNHLQQLLEESDDFRPRKPRRESTNGQSRIHLGESPHAPWSANWKT